MADQRGADAMSALSAAELERLRELPRLVRSDNLRTEFVKLNAADLNALLAAAERAAIYEEALKKISNRGEPDNVDGVIAVRALARAREGT